MRRGLERAQRRYARLTAPDAPKWASGDDFTEVRDIRAARGRERQRAARLALPPDLPDGVGWRAIRAACDRADEPAATLYASLGERLDELVADSEYLARSSATARKAGGGAVPDRPC
ncbi:hypothetical protein [Nonomuraea longicatena]|uniref:Uncharacterized protein n=1 Tax=Nonomuraea longicatena TaxID=83682 RepID=A0ABN1PMY4_9ACTN